MKQAYEWAVAKYNSMNITARHEWNGIKITDIPAGIDRVYFLIKKGILTFITSK